MARPDSDNGPEKKKIFPVPEDSFTTNLRVLRSGRAEGGSAGTQGSAPMRAALNSSSSNIPS